MNVAEIKKRKLLFILVFTMMIAMILGALFISVLSQSNKDLIKNSINTYFSDVHLNNINYLKGFFSSVFSDLFLNTFIWIMGISIIGIVIVLCVFMFKSFLVGFNFISIIYTYGLKGFFLAIIYIIPEIISLFILFVLVYYSISFSCLLFRYLFRKKEITRKIIMVRYLKLLVFMICGTVINNLIGVFVIPAVFRLF